ncbi:MAG: hypothetical protein AAF416_01215 [Pseudomonadota bacterium]
MASLTEESASATGNRTLILDLILGLVLLGTAFFGVAASDVHAGFSNIYWAVLTMIFAVGSFAFAWLHRGEGFAPFRTAMILAAHWIGVFISIQVVFYFVSTNNFTDANVGLANGILFALATYLCGVHVQVRLAVVGAALGLATATEALIEENLWILFAIAIGALIVQAAIRPILHRLRSGNAS